MYVLVDVESAPFEGKIKTKVYINLPKGGNLGGLVLVEDSNRILCRKGVEVPVYYFFR